MPQETVKIDVAMAITRHTATGRFLVIKKSEAYVSGENEEDGRYDITPWEVPGGKVQEEDFTTGEQEKYGHGEIPAPVAVHAATRELQEETGLQGTVVRAGEPYHAVQPDIDVVKDIYFYPVLLDVETDEVVLADSHEHVAYKWVQQDELEEYLMKYELDAFAQFQH